MKYVLEFLLRSCIAFALYFVFVLGFNQNITTTDVVVFAIITIVFQGIMTYGTYRREKPIVRLTRKYKTWLERTETNDWKLEEGDAQVDYPIKRKRGG